MDELVFHVQGSSPEAYVVRFRKNGLNIRATCNCPAGVVGQYCKHRLRILEGSNESIISGNDADVSRVVSWLAGTDVQAAIRELRDAENRLELAKKETSQLKKKLAKALND